MGAGHDHGGPALRAGARRRGRLWWAAGLLAAFMLVEPGELIKDPSGIRTLYVALSRATQRLTTVGTDPDWRPQGTGTATAV